MIIDVRCFLLVEEGELWPDWIINYGAALSGSPREKVKERMEERKLDASGDLLVEDMDEVGIDKALLTCPDHGLLRGTGDKMSLDEYYQLYHRAVERHPGRLYMIGGVDPRRPDAAKFIEKAVKEYGIVGVALGNQQGFFPNERYCYPVYSKCQELGIPVCIYGAPEIPPLFSKSCRPILIDEIASDFPDLAIILNKSISAWWEEAAGIARHKPNVYLDTANSQIVALAKPRWEFYRQLRLLMSIGGAKKVMFASAWPIYRWLRPVNHPNFVKLIKSPPPEVQALGIEFSEEEMDDYFGGNAARIFRFE